MNSGAVWFNTNKINLDITNKCTLKCPFCERQRDDFDDIKKITKDISLADFKKIADYYSCINFCGSIGDPIMHKNFHEMLEYCYQNNNTVLIGTSASHRPTEWYQKAFIANPNAHWTFGLDGLPDDSSIHRVNQDGRHILNMMILANSYGISVKWQFIIFSYNEHQILDCQNIANQLQIPISFVKSSRFHEFENKDEYKPSKDLYLEVNLNKERQGELVPQCLRGREMGHQSSGYVLPCCWLQGDVENKYPLLCNKETKLSGIQSIENLFETNSYKEFFKILTETPENAYDICWERCSTVSKPHKDTIKIIPTRTL